MPARRTTIALVLCFNLAFLSLPLSAATVPSGTEMIVRLDQSIEPGSKDKQQFEAVLAFPVFADGKPMIPAGSRIEGEVRGSKKKIVLSPRYLYLPDGRRLDFNAAVKEIDREKLRADEMEGSIEPQGSKADTVRDAAQIGMTGAAIGAMSTGSAKGMGIGAAAGVAAVLIGKAISGRGKHTVIPSGTQLKLNLARALEVPDDAGMALAPPSSDRSRSLDPADDRRPILRRRD